MRLIDADELKDALLEEISHYEFSIERYMLRLAKNMVDDIPPVEAIPIEWINKFITKKGWQRHYLIEEIINGWRAENEID